MAEDITNKIITQNGFIEHKKDLSVVPQQKQRLPAMVGQGGISEVIMIPADSFEDYSQSFGKINREKNKQSNNEQRI
jgi:hypothetical protein